MLGGFPMKNPLDSITGTIVSGFAILGVLLLIILLAVKLT